MSISVIGAKTGEEVKLNTPEYQKVETEGKEQLLVAEALVNAKLYSREGIVALKTKAEKQLAIIDTIIAEMDKLGVE